MNKSPKKIFWVSLVLLLLVNASFIFLNKSIQAYSSLFIISSVMYLVTILLLNKTSLTKTNLVFAILFLFLLKPLFITTDPIGSDDYYRYLWDGKVQASGINPFLYSPNDKNLGSLHSDLLPEKVSYPHIRTIYFPVSQMFFTMAYWMSGESVVGLKIILFFAEILILISLYYLLLRFSIDLINMLIYAALPLVIFQFFIDAHIDLVGVSLLLASVTLYFYDKKLFSYILLGLSISVKPTGLLLIPFLFQNELKLANKITSVFIPIFIFILTFLPYAFAATPLDTLINYSANWTFNGMIYNVLHLLFYDNLTVRILCGIFFLFIYIFLFISKIDFLKKLYLSLFLLMIFSPVTHPWYLIWFAAFLPVIRSYSGTYFVGAISLTSITVVTYQLTGIWQENLFILLGQYLPLVIIFFYELIKERFWARPIA